MKLILTFKDIKIVSVLAKNLVDPTTYFNESLLLKLEITLSAV